MPTTTLDFPPEIGRRAAHQSGEFVRRVAQIGRRIPDHFVEMMPVEHAERADIHPFLDPQAVVARIDGLANGSPRTRIETLLPPEEETGK